MKQFDFEDKVKELIFNISKEVSEECIRLFNCGGVDPEEYESNYRLPKVCLYVALRNQINKYRPLSMLEEVENLKHF